MCFSSVILTQVNNKRELFFLLFFILSLLFVYKKRLLILNVLVRFFCVAYTDLVTVRIMRQSNAAPVEAYYTREYFDAIADKTQRKHTGFHNNPSSNAQLLPHDTAPHVLHRSANGVETYYTKEYLDANIDRNQRKHRVPHVLHDVSNSGGFGSKRINRRYYSSSRDAEIRIAQPETRRRRPNRILNSRRFDDSSRYSHIETGSAFRKDHGMTQRSYRCVVTNFPEQDTNEKIETSLFWLFGNHVDKTHIETVTINWVLNSLSKLVERQAIVCFTTKSDRDKIARIFEHCSIVRVVSENTDKQY